MPTRTDVQNWNTTQLSSWASELDADITSYEFQLERMTSGFTTTTWRGAAHDAAYDRFTEENTEGRKLSQEIQALSTALRAADARLGNERRVLLGKVSDAESDAESPLALQVNDRWAVQTKRAVLIGVHVTKDDLRKVKDRMEHHEGLINAAYYSLANAISEMVNAISAAAEQIRGRGDLIGKGVDAKTVSAAEAGTLGAEDGKAVHDAVRPDGTIDRKKLDEIAAHLPEGVLTEQQIRDLTDGKEVSTMPAATQEYYKNFFAHAGKDGTLGLSDYLNGQAQSGNTVAASRQSALADGMVAITNEHLGTGRTPDGKLTSPGSYTNLPPDVRRLISGRWEDTTGVIDPFNGVPQQMHQREQLANLLSKTDPGVVGGTTFSMETARQGASLAHYLNDADTLNHGNLPPGMPDDAKPKLETAANQLLDLGTRNHHADYRLLTGKDPVTGDPIPSDLSFGATGDQYHRTGNYDPKDFAGNVFGHTWADHGKTASGLYDWAGSETHDPGPQGDLARRTVDALPSVLTPTHTDQLTGNTALDTASDGKTVFQHMADNFNKNPELANSLARVSAGNLDAYAYAGDINPYDPHPDVKLGLTDAQHMLFLSSQTEQGRQTLDLARQHYDNAAMYQLTQNGGHNIPDPTSYISRMADLDAHIDAATNNAVTYQSGNHIAQQNAQAMQSYTDTKDIADSAKKLVDAIPMSIPGGPVVSAVKGIGEDHAYNALMDSINPQPTPGKLQFRDYNEMQNTTWGNFDTNLNTWARTGNPPLDPGTIGDYSGKYHSAYHDLAYGMFVTNSSDLEQLASGDAQAPNSSGGSK